MATPGTVIAFASPKGGVGKTTAAVHLAALAAEQRLRVTVLDADANEGASRWIAQAVPAVHVERARSSADLLRAIPLLRTDCDLLIVDAPGSDSEATRAVLLRSDVAVICAGCSLLDLNAMQSALETLAVVRDIRGGPPRAIILPTRHASTRVAADALRAMQGCGELVAPPIPTRACIADAPGQGRTAWALDPTAAAPLRDSLTVVLDHAQGQKQRRRTRR